MNSEIKQKWLNELRSGKYEQAFYVLCKVLPDGKRAYCANGILCHIAEKHGIVRTRAVPKNGMWVVLFDGHIDYTPPNVLRWAGLNGPLNHISTLNDFYRKSFEEIADFVEDNL